MGLYIHTLREMILADSEKLHRERERERGRGKFDLIQWRSYKKAISDLGERTTIRVKIIGRGFSRVGKSNT